jgi:hypothetical protein
MDTQIWIDTFGDAALRRSFQEGYDTRRGIAVIAMGRLEKELRFEMTARWDSIEERTSPFAESFAARDAVLAAIETVRLPVGWHFYTGRISRILVEGEPFTGVLVRLFDENQKEMFTRVVDFESERGLS